VVEVKAKIFLLSLSILCLCGVASASALEQGAGHCAAASVPIVRKIPPEIEQHLQDWWRIANFDRVFQVLLGLTGMVSALVVSTFTNELGTRKTKIFSFIAALSFGVMSGFDIGGKADATRSGWRHLTTAILKFKNDPCYSYDQLIDAYSEGEALVGNVPFHTQGSVTTLSSPIPNASVKHE
jgi:hypothetical protein